MFEGFDLSALANMFGGGTGAAGVGGMTGNVPAGYQFGDLTNGNMAAGGQFGGAPSGFDFMNGSLGTNAQNQPLSFGMQGYGQGGGQPNIGSLLGGMGKGMQQPQQHGGGAVPMGGGGGGGGGNMKGLFSQLMRQPNLVHQFNTNSNLGLLSQVPIQG